MRRNRSTPSLKSNLEKQQHLLSWRALLTQLRYLPKALKPVWLAAPGWTAATVASLALQGVLPVAIVLLTRHLVDSLVALIGSKETQYFHVMVAGAIVESGSHAELLAHNGRYAHSWRQQMREEPRNGVYGTTLSWNTDASTSTQR